MQSYDSKKNHDKLIHVGKNHKSSRSHELLHAQTLYTKKARNIDHRGDENGSVAKQVGAAWG